MNVSQSKLKMFSLPQAAAGSKNGAPTKADQGPSGPTDEFKASSAPGKADGSDRLAGAAEPKSAQLPDIGDGAQKDAASKATFDIKEMQTLLDGKYAPAKEKIRGILDAPMFQQVSGLSKEAYREQVLTWCKELARNEMGSYSFPKEVGGKGDMGSNISAFETLAHFDLSLLVKFGVQMGLWGGSVYNLGTEKHHKSILPGVMSLDTPGCFAMTETGHGSNVAALETVAKYDSETDSFVINSTTPGARKDYIGGAAAHAKLATVFAQLEVDGKNQGVHALVVPIRDDDGKAMPGVTITDCGEKKGLNGVDNGRLFFKEVKVPRDNLLDRFGTVDENGKYSSSIEDPNKRFFTMIGTLITGRVSIGAGANSTAKNGLATAIRYAEQRVQFGNPEQKLMDYQAHQARLLPKLAKTYALDFAIKDLIDDYVDVTDETRREVGELAGGLKAMASRHAIDTLQECREACGGQGYLEENKFARWQEDVDIFATFEGDNTILNQLVAKGGLSKLAKNAKQKGTLGMLLEMAGDTFENAWEKSIVYSRRTSPDHLKGKDFHKNAFEYRAEQTMWQAAKKLRKLVKSGVPKAEAANLCQKDLLAAGEAQIENAVLQSFLSAVDNAKPELKPVLDQLCDLYALSTIEENKGWFLQEDYFSGSKSEAISNEVTQLCADIRPNAVGLVDAFGISKKCLAAPIAFGEVPA